MSSIGLKLILTIVFGGVFNIIKIESECNQRNLLLTDKKVDYSIIYHKLKRTGCFYMTIFSAYNIIHNCCEQKKSLN